MNVRMLISKIVIRLDFVLCLRCLNSSTDLDKYKSHWLNRKHISIRADFYSAFDIFGEKIVLRNSPLVASLLQSVLVWTRIFSMSSSFPLWNFVKNTSNSEFCTILSVISLISYHSTYRYWHGMKQSANIPFDIASLSCRASEMSN